MLNSKKDDERLVSLAKTGQKEAFRQLVEKYQTRAFAIAHDIVKSREDAEDIVQESFVKAYLSLSDFKGDAAFYTWLYRIVYNMAIDFRRRKVRQGGESVEFDETVVENSAPGSLQPNRYDSPYESLARKEDAARITLSFQEISPEHRAVIMFREVDGMNYDEIALVTGVSKGTVMSRLHYARKKLQELLSDQRPTKTPEAGTASIVPIESVIKPVNCFQKG